MKKVIGILTIMVVVIILGMNSSYAITYTQEELERIEEIYKLTESESITNEEIAKKLLLPLTQKWCDENNVVIKANIDSSGQQNDGGKFYIGDATNEENMLTTKDIIERIGHEIYEQTGDRENYNDIINYFQNEDTMGQLSQDLQLHVAEKGVLDNSGQEIEDGELNFDEITSNPGYTETTGQDGAGVIGDLFTKAMDALFGIVLYPAKLIILVIGGIFSLIIKGIASLGGEAGEGLLISLKDIIFTTSTATSGTVAGEAGVPIVAIDFFNVANATSEVATIRRGIANWFYVFRNLSIVISLCILIYTGVRMAISSVAEDKAKYKTMLTNWVVQMVLVFFMQYIIFFTIGLNNSIVDALNPTAVSDTTDYMDSLYQQALLVPTLTTGFGSAIVYCVLLGMTFSFLIMYIKRMITIGFLITIAPLVTVTYAIDKMGDSKSQALNTWLKEFVYNVLIQPFHCMIYMVFVSTAMNLLTIGNIGNLGAPVFAILCIMFMNKAEDILRKIFAFDKNAKTLGSGLASAAMLGAGLSTVSSMFKKEESSQKKNTNKVETMPDMISMRENQAVQNAKDNQIEEVQKASDNAVTQVEQQASSNKSIADMARKIEKDRRKNRAIESWQNAGGIGGVALKGAKMQTQAALPVFTALIGAGQGNLKSAVAAGGAGYAMQKGIENAVGNRLKPSQVEMSRQAKANEKVFEEVYKEQEQKWSKEGGRWAKQEDEKWTQFTPEEIANDTRKILDIKDINSIKDKDERQWAAMVHALNDTYKSLGYNNPEGSVIETVRRMKGSKGGDANGRRK